MGRIRNAVIGTIAVVTLAACEKEDDDHDDFWDDAKALKVAVAVSDYCNENPGDPDCVVEDYDPGEYCEEYPNDSICADTADDEFCEQNPNHPDCDAEVEKPASDEDDCRDDPNCEGNGEDDRDDCRENPECVLPMINDDPEDFCKEYPNHPDCGVGESDPTGDCDIAPELCPPSPPEDDPEDYCEENPGDPACE